MTFPDSLYTCARSKRDSSHAHTHTPRQTTHKRPALPRRRRRRREFHAYFSARCFLRRGRSTIIFIVFWVKFCVHDEGLYAAAIGGVAPYTRPPHTQPNSALFPSSPTCHACGLSLHIKRQHLFVSNFNGRVGCCSSNDSSRAK
jgi:hypothetical protein